MNRSNAEARQKGIKFYRFPVQKSRRMKKCMDQCTQQEKLIQATVHAFVASILLVVSPTNCHAIVNTLLETADLNLINAVATVYKYSTIAC